MSSSVENDFLEENTINLYLFALSYKVMCVYVKYNILKCDFTVQGISRPVARFSFTIYSWCYNGIKYFSTILGVIHKVCTLVREEGV